MKRYTAAQLQHNFAPDQILYLTGDINYCFVHLLSGEQILTSRTLKWYGERWPHFVRIHKGSLINPKHIHRCMLVSPTTAYLIMSNNAHLPISRRRIGEVINQLSAKLHGGSPNEYSSESSG
ncbi:LytR/AlgR family response regulator transcription factor [Spirosoma areae]